MPYPRPFLSLNIKDPLVFCGIISGNPNGFLGIIVTGYNYPKGGFTVF
jgi:hypothetical protein